MRIDTTDVKAIFEFSPRTHIMVRAKDDRFPNAQNMLVWTLNPRISREYKGKDDDIAVPTIYLTDEEAEHLKKAGFTYTEMDYD